MKQETLEASLHPITLQLLANRGISNTAEFLAPSYERDIKDPFGIFGMKQAVERIVSAMKKGESIAVYSDYDCDGVPGGVLLRSFFLDIGYPVEIYVPHRHKEGYGLHNHAFDTLKAKGVSLVITVDLAITNIDEVEYAKSVGIDVIVTDHHLPITKEVEEGKGKKKTLHVKQIVPDAVAVINSKQDACEYWDDMLCGCAVAWKVSCAILATLRGESEIGEGKFDAVVRTVKNMPLGYEKWLLDLVGISTVADMVPLQKENRALAYFGLKVLRQTRRPGLMHIFDSQGVSRPHITEDDIAFTIAPRVNAASRMGDPILAHYALYEKHVDTARSYVEELEKLNTQRKAEVKDIVSSLSFDHNAYNDNVVVVGNPLWAPGVLGLIAQNIIDETGKPTFVWGGGEEGGDAYKGSCRSKGDVHVVDLMEHAKRLREGVLLHSGGHEQAGGFAVNMGRVEELREVLNEAYSHIDKKEIVGGDYSVDMELPLTDVTYMTYDAVSVLAPFGVGNPKPIFAFTKVVPVSVRWFGKKSEHLEVVYNKNPGEVKAIMFFAPHEVEEKVRGVHTLHAHIEKSVFRGKVELRLRIVGVVNV